jgi:hypothetical protein
LSRADDPIARRRDAGGGEVLVDVGFAVGHDDHLRRRPLGRAATSQFPRLQPAMAFFLLDGSRRALRTRRTRPLRLRITRPGDGRHRPQGRAVGREGVQLMQERPLPRAAVQRTRSRHGLRRTRQLDFGRVLSQHDDRLGGDPLTSRLEMRREQVLKASLRVGEQPIRGRHLRAPAARRRNARCGTSRQLRQHLPQPPIQPTIAKIRRTHLLRRP